MHRRALWMLLVLLATPLLGCGSSGGVQPAYLLKITDEEPGGRCEFGGKRIAYGQDLDGDGLLSSVEEDIDSTTYICDGQPGGVGIVNVADEPAGANCADGGQSIQSGLDADESGVLEESEVTSTSYICNGTDTTNEIRSLLELTDEEAGENCANGGQRLQSGVDRDANGILEGTEINNTEYLCNIEGVNSLIALADEAAGGNCANGGQRLDVGIDTNNDGTLATEEITVSEYLCDESKQAVRFVDVGQDPYGCLRGGVAVEIGADIDGDGILDDNEVDSSQTSCNIYPLYLTQVEAGGQHACALLSDSTVQCWGDNAYGQLGNGDDGIVMTPNAADPATYDVISADTSADSQTPVMVPTIGDIFKISVGSNHSCALARDGKGYCWGDNLFGQLGDGTSSASPVDFFIEDNAAFIDPRTILPAWSNRPVEIAGIGAIEDIAVGMHHTCAVSGGEVYCWGGNYYGQLGSDASEVMDPFPVPTLVAGLSGITSVAVGDMHSCALKDDGNVFCWGENGDGQVGNGTTTAALTPVQVIGLSGAESISAGHAHNCALLAGGAPYCWGRNNEGQIGDGSFIDRSTPVDVNSLTGARYVSAGHLHSCAVMETGETSCWGSNTNSQLGDGTIAESANPVSVDTTIFDIDQLQFGLGVSLGGYATPAYGVDGLPGAFTIERAFTALINSDGESYAWGSNDVGQLGDGIGADTAVPSQIVIDYGR